LETAAPCFDGPAIVAFIFSANHRAAADRFAPVARRPNCSGLKLIPLAGIRLRRGGLNPL